ncbi:MAG: tRNA 2-thiouridine(34) synthase MnmA [Bdellovibrionia bacterium]
MSELQNSGAILSSSSSSQTVVVGMSGGVDSSVAALLLKQQGYRVIGLFMKNWDEKDENGNCPATQDFEDVARVCEKIDIPFYSIEFIQEYWDKVFADFLAGYKAGYTPNPDILCNREIKFDLFFKKALELGADFLATGHYCQNISTDGHNRLVKGADPGKDQTYFVYTLQEEKLSKILFPIGHLQKSEVREIAKRYGLITHEKKDSTGICFIGERNFRNFLSQYLAAKPGPISNLDGKIIGQHHGAAFYTLGQRKGLQIGGQGEPWFVVGKEVSKNLLFVGQGSQHPALYSDALTAKDPYWVSNREFPTFPFRCKAKARYRQVENECTVSEEHNGDLRIEFDQPQRALTPGQAIVFYQGETCLGGATIDRVSPSYYHLQKPLSALKDLKPKPNQIDTGP